MSSKVGHFLWAISLIISAACTPKGGKFEGPAIDSKPAAATTPDTAPVIAVNIDDRNIEQVLCEEGPKVAAAAKKADFSEEFKLICNGSATTPAFKEAITQAYVGTGTPLVKVLKLSTADNFVTELALMFAIKAPLENPSLFADLKPHDIFAAGIKDSNSELVIKVESRQSFPGKASVEQIVLNYDLKLANGASIHDTRRTEFNTYLLIENNRDIAVSTEHLLDADANEFYHKAQGLTVGIKAEHGQSYMVFVTNLVIKNRIDPARLNVTLTALNGSVAKMLQQYLVSKAAP
ncbi:MAG TPA: hypothetical protein VE954_09215 [Oligoflexus sp.]|uniref:hypothetical protein n=1 Tax=Oligoflexus sp. TaxID=1971216 RepID=UPI002D397167|nr:hypothetical protein [Oligoflexus sp.]HYX33280.1 hypothetical protein [Oligoflexus sp.]